MRNLDFFLEMEAGWAFKQKTVTCLISYFREITLIAVWQKDDSAIIGQLRRGLELSCMAEKPF